MKSLYVSFQILILLFLSACGVPQSDHDQVLKENDELSQKLKEAETKIDELLNGPDRLYSDAVQLIENGEFRKAKEISNQLISKHPLSVQAKEIKTHLPAIDKGIQEKEAEDERNRQRKVTEEKQKLARITSAMRSRHDDIQEVTWYRDKSSPNSLNANGIFAYFGKSNSAKPFLRFVIQYASDDWLFIDKYIIKADNKTYTIEENSYNEIETDNGYGGIWEWLDRSAGHQEIEVLKAIANSKEAKIRYSGRQYYRDRIITNAQKQAIKNTLEAYHAMGGEKILP